ncbi:MAG: AAA family ATPase [Limnochordia bacterium]|nr:AAA family ATPase [Limnochordia bacterium]
MRVSEIEIAAFGLFTDLKLCLKDSNLILIHGSNEAGKSTLFAFLSTMLYGFSPANQAQHPYVPWTGGRPEGAVELVLADGSSYRVERNLASRPAGTLIKEGKTVSLRNRAVPWVEQIPKGLFEEIYMLTQAQMQLFGPRTWEQIGDQLVTGIGTSFLEPVSKVAEETFKEARSLWREDRRRSKSRDLTERIKALREQRKELVTVQDDLRRNNAEEERILGLAQRLRKERDELTAFLKEAVHLQPAYEQLQRIERLSETPWKEEVQSLPPEIGDRFQEILRELETVEAQMKTLAREIEELPPLAPVLGQALALEEEISTLKQQEPLYAQKQEDMQRLVQERTILEEQMASLEKACGSSLTERLALVEREVLEGIIARIRQLNGSIHGDAKPKGSLGWLSLGLAIILTLLGVRLSPWFYLGSVPLWGFAVGRLLVWREWRKRTDLLIRARRDEIVRLGALTMLPESACADETMLDEILRLYDCYEEHVSQTSAIKELEELLECFTSSISGVGKGLGLEGPPAEQLVRMWHLLERAKEAKRESTLMKERTAQKRAVLAARQDYLKERYAQYQEVLGRIGEGDLEQGLLKAQRVQADLQTATVLTQQLQESYHDLEELRRRIALGEQEGILCPSKVSKAQERLSAIERDGGLLDRCKEALAKLAIEKASLERHTTLAEVDSEIAACIEELQETAFMRDRLELTGAILLEAERRFREKHQPSVLKIASSYLEKITQGRYTQVFFEEGSPPQLVVRRTGIYAPIPIKSLSQGTQDQVQFCLRLAIAEHLDGAHEPLPIFLDEIFVNWDRARVIQAKSLVKEVSKKRQIFIFTCHEWFAELLTKNLPVCSISLDQRMGVAQSEGS